MGNCLMPHHQPGWALPNGHVVRSHMEAALCEHLSKAATPHTHGAPEDLSFEVPIGPDRRATYIPSIVLTHSKKDNRTILIEPLDSPHPGGGARRFSGFRHEHGQEYFLVVVARRPLHHEIPADAYDLIIPLEDFEPLEKFLREL